MKTKPSVSLKASFYLLGRNLQDRLELNRLWKTFSDPEAMNDGEKWQYVLSEKKAGVWKHCFRHRMHPTFKTHNMVQENDFEKKVTIWMEASEEWALQMEPVSY